MAPAAAMVEKPVGKEKLAEARGEAKMATEAPFVYDASLFYGGVHGKNNG